MIVWPCKTIGHPFYVSSSFGQLLCYFKLCTSFHSHQWNQTGVTVQKQPMRVKIDDFLSRVTLKFDRWPWKTMDLEILQMTSKNNRTPLPYCFKFCASFHSHQWIQTGVTVRKCPIWVKSGNLFVTYDLEFQWMTLKNNRAPLLCHIKLCASFHHHMWIQTGVTVRKRLNWVLTSCDLWW